jgi:hypothetical protein
MFSTQDLILDERWLRRAGAIMAYLAGCILIAYWVGTFQVFYLYLVVQLAILAYLILRAQRRAWILILLGWSLAGPTAFFKVPISVRDFSVLASLCAYIVYRVVSQDATRYKWRFLDAIVAINAAYLVFTLALNPVGLNAFGAGKVGARPYFTCALALAGYWVIWRLPNSIKTVSRIPLFILAGSAAATSLFALAYLFPSLPGRIPYLYAALNVEAYFSSVSMMRETAMSTIARYKEFAPFGVILLATLYAYFQSAKLFNPLRPWLYAFAVGAVCILISGFRNFLVSTCAMFGITVWLRHGWRRFIITSTIGGMLLLGVAAGQGRLYDLPLSTQRALSLLPGQWAPEIVIDTTASTEGRIKWWRQAIEEHSIKDWWFGDGFGVIATELGAVVSGGGTAMAELTGAYHSGPLTAVRYVGLVGLLLFYVLSITAAVYACRCVRKCKGTVLQPVTLFVAMQLVWFPVNYTLIFGAYNTDMPQLIFEVGLLRLVMRMAADVPVKTAATEKRLSAPEVYRRHANSLR